MKRVLVQHDATPHLLPAKEQERHVVSEGIWCPCAPTALLDDTDLSISIYHISLASRKWGRVFEAS